MYKVLGHTVVMSVRLIVTIKRAIQTCKKKELSKKVKYIVLLLSCRKVGIEERTSLLVLNYGIILRRDNPTTFWISLDFLYLEKYAMYSKVFIMS